MSFALSILIALAAASVAGAAPPTPEAFLGHRVGADGKLADYGQIVRYFETLDRESGRLALHRLGKSTLGRDLVMAVISSEANVRDIDTHRATARRLADPRGLSPGEAERLVAEGKVIVLVTCQIHSNEVGSSQMAMEWAHRLVTAEDQETRGWLDDVIVLLMPSINPDGTDMIADYYRKYAGTEWEGGRLPWLYHHYAGHDNNRDWYMLNLVETRLVNRVLHHEWFPQVFLDQHQMGSTTPRIFVPPYADPHTPLVHPLQWRLNDLVGTHMALRLEQSGKSGVIHSYAFDAYWPGGTKNTAALKNVIGLLTEVASCRIASPVHVDPSELAGGRKGLPEYRAQMNFPNPWPGGWWRLRDIVDYELIVSNSLLETCARHRRDILRSFYVMGRDAIESRNAHDPYAYVIPPDQHDPAAARQLVDILRENGLEATIALDGIETQDGRRFPPGSVVFLAAQPYRPFLIEMMERQRYPEVRQGPDTKEIFRPYDVTAWTLPLLMGVSWARIDRPFELKPDERAQLPWDAPHFPERAEWLALPAESNQSYAIVNRLLASGVRVDRLTDAVRVERGSRSLQPGAFVVPGDAAAKLRSLAAERFVDVDACHPGSDVPRARLRAPRLAMYKPWAASMDEGWTRLVLDRHEFKYTSLDNAAVKHKGLGARHDVIVLPDVEKHVIVEGRPRQEEGPSYFEPLPPPYAGGIGKDGVENLKAFVEQGGTLVCLGSSGSLAIEEMNLPVRDVVGRLKATEFSAPGTLVNLTMDPSHPLGYGMPEKTTAYVTGGPVFSTNVPGAGVGRAVAARYPVHAGEIVASGWAHGTEKMAGRPAIVEVALGKGRVVLLGPRVQHRGQAVGTYKLLFNAIYRGVMAEQTTAVAGGRN